MNQHDSFKEHRSVVLPAFVLEEVQKHSVRNQLYITDIGYFPNVSNHKRIRKVGVSQYILIYCTEGEGWVSIGGKQFEILSNQLVIIPPNIPHSYGSRESNSWSIYWVHFSGYNAKYYLSDTSVPQIIPPSQISRIDDRIDLFHEIITNLEMGFGMQNVEYANVCLAHFLASIKYLRQFRQVRRAHDIDVVENSIHYMKSNLPQKLTLKDFAREAQLSASHFSSVFKEKTGRSPLDYFIHLRIQRACQLLDHSTFKINEIATEVGFQDSYYFSRMFSQVMGCSPKIYRNLPKG